VLVRLHPFIWESWRRTAAMASYTLGVIRELIASVSVSFRFSAAGLDQRQQEMH
jgi:hypothetical protein